jgi:hypothetical protein
MYLWSCEMALTSDHEASSRFLEGSAGVAFLRLAGLGIVLWHSYSACLL